MLDETAFLKKGDKSVGGAPQYAGITGQTENCQVAVFLAYVTPYGRALIDFALYLGRLWAGQAVRCREAGVPRERSRFPGAHAGPFCAVSEPLPHRAARVPRVGPLATDHSMWGGMVGGFD
ncbi:hypothetical protein GCM10010254_58940 [Streptomyces chromofuscus]|uniref:Transposase n=1 Tax=Streptomyces chromofuscus TaxID=42881 RepID=A0A7M2T3U2_STRCW|nr:transposase [Streptomyces chromofuscus]GGT30595.1 hypothetical protein GCM10010254_58940 [Streptomyces chromofuscus]